MTGSAVVRRWEIWIVWALGAIALAAVPVLQGRSGIIWDALNHHIYLGWIAGQPRFDRDFLAAGWQSYQYPYLYWPAYKLALSGISGASAGVVLAALQSLAVPPLWLVARSLSPGDRAEDIALRWLAVALALAGGITLSLVDTTSNDVLAGIPLIWAIALGLLAHQDGAAQDRRVALIALSGVCAGVAVAFKLSNGPLALVLPMLWGPIPGAPRLAARHILVGGVATVLAFVLAFAPWGWQMWQQFGNPVYPYRDDLFEIVRTWLGWRRA